MNFLKLCHQNMKNYLLILAVLVMVGCGNRQTHPQEQCNTVDSTTIKRIVPHGEYNSIYHWKTTFNPINSELAFLRKHNVKRLYLRFFDVALDNHWENCTQYQLLRPFFGRFLPPIWRLSLPSISHWRYYAKPT